MKSKKNNKTLILKKTATSKKGKMKLTCILTKIFLLFSITIIAQNQAPIVDNIYFTQRTDGSFKVDIDYSVQDPDGDRMTITMEVSDDAGSTYNIEATSLTGDIGNNISSGWGKRIVWDFGLDYPDYTSDQIVIKIIADDNVFDCGSQIAYEGKTYNTVQVGPQCWLKENLDVGKMVRSNPSSDDQTDNDVIEKYCYNNDLNNCDTYGGLYNWSEAMQYVTFERAKGICPSGWHIPKYAEFETLKDAVSGNSNALKAIGQGSENGEGTNTSGFSALLAGVRIYYSGDFNLSLGQNTYFWSSTEASGIANANNLILSAESNSIGFYYNTKHNGLSVRCLLD